MPSSSFRAAADLVVVLHVGFVAFVMAGGVLVLRWRRLLWLHLPAAVWGAAVEFLGWVCPLTPLENYLRERAGEARYAGDFVERYVLPLLYPARLTRSMQFALGALAVGVNALVYWWIYRTRARVTSGSTS